MKKQGYRHGEILFVKINKLPKGLKKEKTNIFLSGSHGHSHSYDKGKLYLKEDGQTFGYFVAKDTSLIHSEHSPKGEAKLPDGIYQLIRQNEYTPEGLIPVID